MKIRALSLVLLLACQPADPGPDPTPIEDPGVGVEHPFLILTADRREVILQRVERAPYDAILQQILARADEPWRPIDPEDWDHAAHGRNGEITQANALLAWLLEEEERAARAREGMALLQPNLEDSAVWDLNIRMPHAIMGYANAYDLLMGTPWFPEEEARDAQARLTDLNRAFWDRFVANDTVRHVVLGLAQNNHPIRTATAIGYVGLLFPDDPDADRWLGWALSELEYLWGPDGQYVAEDGGVSEGPFYYGFAFGVSMAFALAADQALPPGKTFLRDCRNRLDTGPWEGHGCVDGEPFVFQNPLHDPLFHSTVDWSISTRLPSGLRPPLADGYLNPLNGGALLGGFTGEGHYQWDWQTMEERAYELHHGIDLTAHHLAWLDDEVLPQPPPWRNRFLPASGHAIFRSGWDPDARWLLLVAEHGSARKTLHDHVDGTSFSMAAYGDYLLIDPGYYKPSQLDNAVTAQGDSHNVILIEGQGAPDKGLLHNFGDTDAFLRHTLDGEVLAYAEAHQRYEQTEIERSVVFVDQRYFIVADRLQTTALEPREHRWRLGGNAGFDVGGIFEVRPDGARWIRERGAVDVHLASTAPGLEVVEPPLVPYSRPHVGQFQLDRAITHHGVIDGRVDALAPGYLAVLAPWAVDAAPGSEDAPLQVEALPAAPGQAAYRITGPSATDLVLLRDRDAAATLTVPEGILSTDAELAVLRLSGPRPFALMARGSVLELDGEILLEGEAPVVRSP